MLFSISIDRTIDDTPELNSTLNTGSSSIPTVPTKTPLLIKENIVVRGSNITINWTPSALAKAQIINIQRLYQSNGYYYNIGHYYYNFGAQTIVSSDLNKSFGGEVSHYYPRGEYGFYDDIDSYDTGKHAYIDRNLSASSNSITIKKLIGGADYNVSISTIDAYDNNFTTSVVIKTLTNTATWSLKENSWNMVSIPHSASVFVRDLNISAFNLISDIWTYDYDGNAWVNGYDGALTWNTGIWIKASDLAYGSHRYSQRSSNYVDYNFTITNDIAADISSPTVIQQVNTYPKMVAYIKNTLPKKKWILQGIAFDTNNTNTEFRKDIQPSGCELNNINTFHYSKDYNSSWVSTDSNISNLHANTAIWLYKNCN